MSGQADIAVGPAVIAVPAGVSVKVTDLGGGGYSVQNLGGGSVTITAGGVATTLAANATVTIDTTPPVITPVITGTLGNNGWYRSNVGLTLTVADAQSSISGRTGCAAGSVTADTAGRTFSCAATSAGGTTTQTVTIKRDATPPSAAFAVHPATYGIDQLVSFGCTTTDAGSGVATGCSGISAPAWTLPVGLNTRSSTASDLAGNTRTVTTTFTVSVTSAGVCALTKQFVQGSARYAGASAAQRAAADVVMGAGCASLSGIRPSTPAVSKAVLIAAYRATLTLLAQQGFLTSAQVTTLSGFTTRL